MELQDKRVQIHLARNGFRYAGKVLDDDPAFVELLDDHTGRVRIIAKDSIESIEVLE